MAIDPMPYCIPLREQGLDPLDPLDARLYTEKICPQCPLQDDCLQAGRGETDPVGVWGGVEVGQDIDTDRPCTYCGTQFESRTGQSHHVRACIRQAA